jgi:hypothetical protein
MATIATPSSAVYSRTKMEHCFSLLFAMITWEDFLRQHCCCCLFCHLTGMGPPPIVTIAKASCGQGGPVDILMMIIPNLMLPVRLWWCARANVPVIPVPKSLSFPRRIAPRANRSPVRQNPWCDYRTLLHYLQSGADPGLHLEEACNHQVLERRCCRNQWYCLGSCNSWCGLPSR